MPVERLLALVLAVLSGILLVRFGPPAVHSWRIYAGTGRRRQKDATDRAPATPPGVRDRQALLAESGYRPLGVTSLDLPVGERFAWIMAADDADSYAILAGGMSGVPLTGIYSAWQDGMWLGTMHPIGSATDGPRLQVRVVPTTIADAVRAHRAASDRLRSVHGAPRQVRSMPDMLALDADYRVRFGGSRLRRLTFRNMLPAVLAGCMLVLSLAILAISFRSL
jgi:hypothetical protein